MAKTISEWRPFFNSSRRTTIIVLRRQLLVIKESALVVVGVFAHSIFNIVPKGQCQTSLVFFQTSFMKLFQPSNIPQRVKKRRNFESKAK
jgi:hypothetical protein